MRMREKTTQSFKKMQLDVGSDPTLRSAYVTCIIKSIQTDGQTESDAYEPTVQNAQVGSITH